MKVIIVEDEKPAAEKLRKAIAAYDPLVEVQSILTSAEAAVTWFTKNSMPELIFMDIELTDGLSFKIFKEVKITCPVIFTTAYDEYWQEAFEHNSIDYLLKPLKKDKLELALKKYHTLKEHFADNLQGLIQWKQAEKKGYKKRFLVKRGTELISVKTEETAYFYASHKLVCLVTFSNQKYILDNSVSDIEKEIDPSLFYRVNRKYLVNVNAISRMKAYSKGKVLIELNPSSIEEIIISQDSASDFKNWIGS